MDGRDGQSYATVQIGLQCWMAQNLNVGTMTLGTSTQGTSVSPVSSIQKYCYNNDPAQCAAVLRGTSFTHPDILAELDKRGDPARYDMMEPM